MHSSQQRRGMCAGTAETRLRRRHAKIYSSHLLATGCAETKPRSLRMEVGRNLESNGCCRSKQLGDYSPWQPAYLSCVRLVLSYERTNPLGLGHSIMQGRRLHPLTRLINLLPIHSLSVRVAPASVYHYVYETAKQIGFAPVGDCGGWSGRSGFLCPIHPLSSFLRILA